MSSLTLNRDPLVRWASGGRSYTQRHVQTHFSYLDQWPMPSSCNMTRSDRKLGGGGGCRVDPTNKPCCKLLCEVSSCHTHTHSDG